MVVRCHACFLDIVAHHGWNCCTDRSRVSIPGTDNLKNTFVSESLLDDNKLQHMAWCALASCDERSVFQLLSSCATIPWHWKRTESTVRQQTSLVRRIYSKQERIERRISYDFLACADRFILYYFCPTNKQNVLWSGRRPDEVNQAHFFTCLSHVFSLVSCTWYCIVSY